jgi:hypothetical protein
MSETPDDIIERVLRRDAEATPKPWDSREWGLRPEDGPTEYRVYGKEEGGTVAFTHGYSRLDSENAALIAEYRSDAPALARMLRTALADNAALLAALAKMISAVQWMSGSDSFAPDGISHKGWLGVRPDLFAAMDVFKADHPGASMLARLEAAEAVAKAAKEASYHGGAEIACKCMTILRDALDAYEEARRG